MSHTYSGVWSGRIPPSLPQLGTPLLRSNITVLKEYLFVGKEDSYINLIPLKFIFEKHNNSWFEFVSRNKTLAEKMV